MQTLSGGIAVMKPGWFAALALAMLSIIAAPACGQESETGYLDRLVDRDFVACLPDAPGVCPDGGVIPVGVRTTEEGRVLFKMYGTEFARVKEFRAPLYDFELYREAGGLHMMADFLAREHDATQTATSIEFTSRDRLVTIFARDGHPVLREMKIDGSKVFHEVNLMPPGMAGPKLVGKFANMREKYGAPAQIYEPLAEILVASGAAPIGASADEHLGDPARWGYIARLAGRDYVACTAKDPKECDGSNSYPMLVREIAGGYVTDEATYERRFFRNASGTLVVEFERYDDFVLVSADPLETVITHDKETVVFTEIEGRPARVGVYEGAVQSIFWLHDPMKTGKDFSRKLAGRHKTYGTPTASGHPEPLGRTGSQAQALVARQEEKRIALARADANRATNADNDDGSHARSVRKGLGGVLGGVLGALAGAQLGMGMSGTEAIGTALATATAGALVGSGEISPEDALAATNAVTTGMAQGYADAAAQNTQTAAVMAQARAADAEHAARQAKLSQQPMDQSTGAGGALLQRERELAAQLAAVREQRAAQERAASSSTSLVATVSGLAAAPREPQATATNTKYWQCEAAIRPKDGRPTYLYSQLGTIVSERRYAGYDPREQTVIPNWIAYLEKSGIAFDRSVTAPSCGVISTQSMADAQARQAEVLRNKRVHNDPRQIGYVPSF